VTKKQPQSVPMATGENGAIVVLGFGKCGTCNTIRSVFVSKNGFSECAGCAGERAKKEEEKGA